MAALPLRLLKDPSESAFEQIQALGYRPEDVRHIIPTHLDLDHAGELSDFPHATVHVLRPELEAAQQRRSLIDKFRYRSGQWSHGPNWNVLEVKEGEAWSGFDFARPKPGIPEELLLVPLLDHSTGHCGVAVRSTDGWLFHAGDACFDTRELDPENPRGGFGVRLFKWFIHFDRAAAHNNLERLRTLKRRKESPIQIVKSHDPTDWEGMTGKKIL